MFAHRLVDGQRNAAGEPRRRHRRWHDHRRRGGLHARHTRRPAARRAERRRHPGAAGSVVADANGAFTVLLQVSSSIGQGGWRLSAVVAGVSTPPVALLIQQGVPQPGSPGGRRRGPSDRG